MPRMKGKHSQCDMQCYCLHFLPCIYMYRLLRPAGIGLRELFSSEAVQNFLYGPTINAEKAIYQPGALRKVYFVDNYIAL